MADRPGMMFYFDVLDDLSEYTTDEIGQLFLAVMHYGSTGETTVFQDRGMKTLFNSMIRLADRDQSKYDLKVLKSKHSRYTGIQKKAGKTPLEFDEWYETIYKEQTTDVNERQRMLTDVNERQRKRPTTTSTINYQLSTDSKQQERDARGNQEPSADYLEMLKKLWKDAIAHEYVEEARRLRTEIEKYGGFV